MLYTTRIALLFSSVFLARTPLPAQEEGVTNSSTTLKSGSATEVATAISSLSVDELKSTEIAKQLTLLLDDDRYIVQHFMGSETVNSRAWIKMFGLPPTAVSSILDSIPDLKTNDSRARAFEVITRIGVEDRRAYERTLPFCSEDDVFLRSRAISALSVLADNSDASVSQFGQFLRDPHPMVKWTAMNALDLRSKKIATWIPSIIELLDDDSDVYIAISDHALIPEKLRGRTARLLAKIGSDASAAIPKLWSLTGTDYDKNVRIWSATAICKITDSPQPEALDLLGQLLLDDIDCEYDDSDAPEAIAELGPLAVKLLDSLEQAKKHASPQIRWGLVDAFFAVDPVSAVSRSLPLMDDEEDLVVAIAINRFSSRDIADERVIDAYIRVLQRHDGDFYDCTNSAVEALAKLGYRARVAAPALEALKQDVDLSDSSKQTIEEALKKIR